MADFEAKDEVVGLKCSIYHVYHEKCLEDQLKTKDKKCAMCRAKIEKLKVE